MQMVVGGYVVPPSKEVRLTDEQQEIVERSKTGETFKVEALAGTGKTATLVTVAAARPQVRMLYVAFNRSVAEEARRRFGANVAARTAHSLAFAAVGKHYDGRIQRNLWALKVGIAPLIAPTLRAAHKPAQQYTLAVLDTIGRYQNAAEREIGPVHVPAQHHQLDLTLLLDLARAVWAAMADRSEKAPITDDSYLKLWQLRGPNLPGEVVLFDEAQDASPVMLDVVSRQLTMQQLYVGDTNQQIYEWRGATNALGSLELPALPLTQSWRFGNAIATFANRILAAKEQPLRVKGSPGREDRVVADAGGTPDVVLARTNSGLVAEALRWAGETHSIALVGGVDTTVRQLEGAYELYRYNRTRHPFYTGINSWQELTEAADTEQGQQYRAFVTMVQTYRQGVPEVCIQLREAERPEGEARVLLCTVHRFKGKEGAHVRLADDLEPFAKRDIDGGIVIDEEAANLDYVAVTRAKALLDLAGFAETFRTSCALAEEHHGRPLTVSVAEAPAAPTTKGAPQEVPVPSRAPAEPPLSAIEEELAATFARLERGSAWLDAKDEEIKRLEAAGQATAASWAQDAYEEQMERWTALLDRSTELAPQCPHTRRSLVRLVDSAGTSYPYERCATCRQNAASTGVYLSPDDPRLAGVNVASLPVSTDYLTPEEALRMEAQTAAWGADEAAAMRRAS